MGHPAHLHVRDVSLALVSRAPLANIESYRKRMGWTLPWYSSADNDFNIDFGQTTPKGETLNNVVSRPSATSGRCWTSRRTVARRNGKTLLPVGRKPRRIRGGEDTTSIERKSGFSKPGLERMRRVLSGYVERKELPGLVALVSHDEDVHADRRAPP